MRVTLLVTLLWVFMPIRASAETAWESYVRAPSQAAAAAVSEATYSVPSDGSHFESDLTILEYEVAAGDTESIMLSVRLLRQWQQSAAISEYLGTIIGRSIRANAAGYLQAILDASGCPGASPSGDFFVDRGDARNMERQARVRALANVRRGTLQKKRNECIASLKQASS